MKAIKPIEIPVLPKGATHWSRSTKRSDTVFHAHSFGRPICGARFLINRFDCVEARNLGDFQYHGVCPSCYRLSTQGITEMSKAHQQTKARAVSARIKEIAPDADMTIGVLDETRLDLLILALGIGAVELEDESHDDD